MSKLIVGCGYLGERLARVWRESEETVYVTTRSVQRAKTFSSAGFLPIVLDVTNPPNVLPEVDDVVFAVGFDRGGEHTIREVYVEGLKRAVGSLPNCVKRLIYVSSTGVYGQSDGAWIDESSPCRPTREGGQACLAAEEFLQQSPLAEKTIIMRLAGIYGPGRLPQLASLRRGEPLQVAADSYLNLIHVDDAAQIVAACARDVSPPELICVADGNPVLRSDFYRELAEQADLPGPQFDPPPPGSSRADRARGDKRIRNDHLQNLINYRFQYPTFRQGLAEILAEESSS